MLLFCHYLSHFNSNIGERIYICPVVDRVKSKIDYFKRIFKVTVLRRTIHLTRKIVIPGFEGISLWEILFFFFWSLRRGLVGTRASSLAFHFFLAMIPFGLVLVIVSAYVPFFDLDQDIIPVFKSFIPESLFNNFINRLTDFQNSTVNSLISFGFILALYFSSNGFSVLIRSFNSSRTKFAKRNWWSVKLISIVFVFGVVLGILLLFFAILVIRKSMGMWAETSRFVMNNLELFTSIITFFVVGFSLYLALACIYYFAPSNRKQFRFFSAGGTLSTIMFILISELYSFYIQKFARYNELYGSLGTIMMLLLWIYLISFVLLLGFELNASIHGAMQKKKLDDLTEIKERYENGEMVS